MSVQPEQVSALERLTLERGAATERAKVVAWLRLSSRCRYEKGEEEWAKAMDQAAGFIERGNHAWIDNEGSAL